MAQRTEKEETECKVPETISLCINNCGLTGNPTTNNMCQKCFNSTTLTTTTASSSSAAASHMFSDDKIPRSSSARSPQRSNPPRETSRIRLTDLPKPDESVKREVNRCSGCRKRVGLTGFRCRCGELFCSDHRYSDRHDCSYDYKAAGREAIARENPVVKAAKIVRV